MPESSIDSRAWYTLHAHARTLPHICVDTRILFCIMKLFSCSVHVNYIITFFMYMMCKMTKSCWLISMQLDDNYTEGYICYRKGMMCSVMKDLIHLDFVWGDKYFVSSSKFTVRLLLCQLYNNESQR